ncbi:MAG: phospholipid/cholesterol/gamma-HCH transport system substrate-binding protein [Marinoscillum sp.]|jgi:phospholipid/cholesterol/gamma-HCH transport system substrate-binding protein
MSKEFKVGLIALIAGALMYYGFNFLKGKDFFSPTNKYYAIYNKVDGLNKSNPVIINGLTVGRVGKIRLLQSEENLILVELNIDDAIVLGDSTVAALSNTDFLGSKGVILTVNSIERPLIPGDTLISVIDKGLEDILASAEPVANNLNTTITRINEILIGLKGSGETINVTLNELKKTTISVNEIIGQNQNKLAQIMNQTSLLVQNLNRKLDGIDPVFAKTEGLLDSLSNLQINETLATIRAAVNGLNETVASITNEEGTLGKLISNDSLYNSIDQTMSDLDQLIIHMDQYPKHFFAPLGKKHSKVMQDLGREE